MSDLDVFKDVKEITGYLMVEGSPVTNLSFLSNLEVVGGKQLM